MGLDRNRAEALAAFFLSKASGNCLNDLKLMKLMYIAERESLAKLYSTLTNDDFVSMPLGPVLSRTYNILRGRESVSFDTIQYLSKRAGQAETNTFKLVGAIDPSLHFSQAELMLLTSVWERFKNQPGYKMAKMTHDQFAEWDETAAQKNTSIELPIEKIYAVGLGFDESTAKELAHEARYFASMEQ